MYRNELSLFALTLLVVAAYIIIKQSRAKSCPAHSQIAGRIAGVLAALLIIVGAAVLVWAWLLT